MSTIAIVRKNGAVAIAADTLGKDGSTMMRAARVVNHSKILRVADSFIGITGTDAWTVVLNRYFSRLKEPPQLGSVAEIFETMLRLHSVLPSRYGLSPSSEDRDFESSHFNFLLANNRGIFALYPDRSVTEFATFYAFGSGYRFALGAMHVAYASMERPEDIARAGIEAGAEFDEDTGLPVEVHRIELLPPDAAQPTTRERKTRKSR